MINYTTKFFNLDILKIKEIKLHETTEFNRLRNIYDRISGSKYLLNPVIVGKSRKGYLLIDGANRLSTLKEIGCKLIVCQIIDYNNPRIKLRNWNHLIYNIGNDEIKAICEKIGLEWTEIKYNAGYRILNSGFNYVLSSEIQNQSTLLIHLSRKFSKMICELNSLTRFYFNKYAFDRSEEEIRFADLKKYSRKEGILVEFPRFKKEQIVKIADSDVKLPAGISRHILDNRVLHVRYDISKLKDDRHLDKKKKDLDEYILSKIDNNKVRQYRESVIVFDE
ncbi:MAG: hypothetical protein PHN88_11790 [Ignavibacteria bacterium]|nr:hypothetical protein [Ignavibacteria bacterium]